MGVDWRAADDAETFGLQGLQPDLVAVRCPRLLNPGDKQTLERLEQQVLHRNREREHAVEEGVDPRQFVLEATIRSEEHTSELQSLMRISYAVFCLNKKTPTIMHTQLSHT